MTATEKPLLGGAPRRLLAVLLAALLPAVSCESDGGESTGGETHFLASCELDSSACGADLECLCGVCTLPCDADGACGALPGAVCRLSEALECAEARCDVECEGDADCAGVSTSHRCESGVCRAAPTPGSNGEGGAGGAGSEPCAQGDVAAGEVVVIGDSFFATTHEITAQLEELARAEGALAADQGYRDYSNLTENALALGDGGIASQYADAVAEGSVRLVIMNGGGADALAALCETSDDCPPLPAAAAALEELFRTMAAQGVLEVVYAFYPDPVDATVRSRIDVLRPLIESACANGPVRCHWLDLRDTFAGHYTEYVMGDGLNPTDAGSRATAEAIWATLQGSCLAQ
jgi:hypothetical protein